MESFLLLVCVCSVALCGFSQRAGTADEPFAVLSYSVQKLPYRPRLVTFPTSDASIPGPTSIRRQPASDINPTLRQENDIPRRSAELQNLERNARSTVARPREGYQYKMKARNQSSRTIERVFWQYQTGVPATSPTATTRQFLCGNRVKPNDSKEFIIVTPFAPSNVVNVKDMGKEINGNMGGRAVVNRIEYADGTSWEDPKWVSARIKLRLNDQVYRSAKGRCVVL